MAQMKSEAQECKTPIVFIVFNRPEHTASVLQRIAQVRPSRLLVIADGPRTDRPGESATCQKVRDIATQVEWPCEVLTNFSDTNLGCRRRVISGLKWAFEHVEEAIILEDDVVPDVSFFRFCDEMLARFRGDSRISMITGFNIVPDHPHSQWSYSYSQLTHIWGWATWRRSWAMYDEHLSDWPSIKAACLMQELFPLPAQCRFWTRIFDEMYNDTGPDTWDYQWAYTNLVQRRLSITPRVNLIENIGFGPGATHTHRVEDAPSVAPGSLSFPLIHPPAMIPLRKMDELDGRLSQNSIPGIPERVVRKLGRVFTRAFTVLKGANN
jgi:hypothetical protein